MKVILLAQAKAKFYDSEQGSDPKVQSCPLKNSNSVYAVIAVLCSFRSLSEDGDFVCYFPLEAVIY